MTAGYIDDGGDNECNEVEYIEWKPGDPKAISTHDLFALILNVNSGRSYEVDVVGIETVESDVIEWLIEQSSLEYPLPSKDRAVLHMVKAFREALAIRNAERTKVDAQFEGMVYSLAKGYSTDDI